MTNIDKKEELKKNKINLRGLARDILNIINEGYNIKHLLENLRELKKEIFELQNQNLELEKENKELRREISYAKFNSKCFREYRDLKDKYDKLEKEIRKDNT